MSNSPIHSRVVAACLTLLGSTSVAAADCVADNCTIVETGQQSFNTEFPIGIPITLPVNTYLGTAYGAAHADGAIAADAGSKQGTKLTIAAGTGKATPGTVTKTSTIPAPPTAKGSSSTGSTVLTGSAVITTFGGFHGLLKTTYSATLTPFKGGSADYHGITYDPYPFGAGGFTGTGLVDFNLTLPSVNSLVPEMPNGDWSLTFSAGVSDISTYDDQTFWMSDPGIIYSVTFGADATGAFAHFTAGSPAGFPVTFDKTESQIEADLMDAVTHGSSTDLDVFDGTVDLTGHATATLGNASEFVVDLARPVPEPSPLLLWTTPLLVLLWRRRGAGKAI